MDFAIGTHGYQLPRAKLGAVWSEVLLHLEVAAKVRSSGVLVALCPFHSEKTPSLHCWPQSGRFRCHGCEEFGDVVDFIVEAIRERPAVDVMHISSEREDCARTFLRELPISSGHNQMNFVF